jgi:hypothetical protein
MADIIVEREQYREENNFNLRHPHDSCAQTTNGNHCYKCVSCEAIENLRRDLEEFGNLQEMARCQAVKDAIQVEINVLLVRIKSLKVQTCNSHENEDDWCKVARGRKRPVLVKCQQKLPT